MRSRYRANARAAFHLPAVRESGSGSWECGAQVVTPEWMATDEPHSYRAPWRGGGIVDDASLVYCDRRFGRWWTGRFLCGGM